MKRPRYLLITIGVLVLDQWTKFLIVKAIPLGSDSVVTSWFSIVHWRNSGGLFGMLDNLSPHWRMGVFLVIPVCGTALLVYLFARADDWKELALLAAVLGGAAGNLLDRVRLGSVVDFLYFHIPKGPGWPAFNVADAFLSTSIIAYVALYVFGSKKGEPKSASGSLHDR